MLEICHFLKKLHYFNVVGCESEMRLLWKLELDHSSYILSSCSVLDIYLEEKHPLVHRNKQRQNPLFLWKLTSWDLYRKLRKIFRSYSRKGKGSCRTLTYLSITTMAQNERKIFSSTFPFLSCPLALDTYVRIFETPRDNAHIVFIEWAVEVSKLYLIQVKSLLHFK